MGNFLTIATELVVEGLEGNTRTTYYAYVPSVNFGKRKEFSHEELARICLGFDPERHYKRIDIPNVSNIKIQGIRVNDAKYWAETVNVTETENVYIQASAKKP